MSIDTYFCFCCLSTNDLSPLYNDGDADYGNTLLQLFNLNISHEDYEYDGYICIECAQRLKEAAQFRAQVFDILNILQSNGLIELTNTDLGLTVKKVNNENPLDADEKYEKLTIKDVVNHKIATENLPQKRSPIKKELTQEAPPKLEQDKAHTEVRRKITHYEVTEDLRCEVCSEELPNAYTYHTHMNQHFPNHICDTCGKGFLTEKRLKRHLPSHKTGPFKCQSCDAEFTNYNTLNSHRQRKHSSILLYRCPHCAERFATLTRRATHLARSHAPPARHRCRMCDKRFLLAGNLSAHIRNKHQRIARYKCTECRATFILKQELIAHAAVHTGFSPYTCPQCPKSYPRKKALTVHMRTHTDDRRFSCEYCGKRFIQKCTLLIHIKTHTRAAEKSGAAEK